MGEWVEPDAGARCACDDGVVRTWSQLVAGLEPEDYPASGAMCRDLLWAFGTVSARGGQGARLGARSGRRNGADGPRRASMRQWLPRWAAEYCPYEPLRL